MRRLSVLLVAAVTLAGCGYAPMYRAGVVPNTVDRLYVDVDAGTRGDPELADVLGRALRRLVRRDARFHLAADSGGADAVLRVEFVSSATRPVAFDRFDDPLDYETTVSVDARLRAHDGTVMWTAHDIGATRAHAAVAGAVVTSSSSFQSSERLRPEDLAILDTVQLGEERLTHAHDAIAEDLAATIYLRMMEGR
jgi:hypothetical protein